MFMMTAFVALEYLYIFATSMGNGGKNRAYRLVSAVHRFGICDINIRKNASDSKQPNGDGP